MVIDGEVSLTKVIAAALWTVTTGLLALAWGAWFIGQGGAANMLGLTACASSAISATASIRCYSVNICTLLRATAMLDEARGSVRPMR